MLQPMKHDHRTHQEERISWTHFRTIVNLYCKREDIVAQLLQTAGSELITPAATYWLEETEKAN